MTVTVAAGAFWLALLALLYTYAGYPLILAALAPRAGRRRAPSPGGRGRGRRRLSVIIAAFNEVECIGAKLDSTLARQRYPWDAVEAIVVSDGSTDGTDARVTAYPDPRVRLIRQEPRAGKSVALNRAVAAARGDILVFTDANAMFAPDALARLAAVFDDPRVGLVSGQGLYASAVVGDPRVVSNGYVRYEALLKSRESSLGFVAAADGAIYAMRRALYRDLEPAEVNDLLHPIQVALAGQVSRFDPQAFTVEPPSRSAVQEFRRHVRIIAQGMYLVHRWLPALLAARRWRPVWVLVSHRVLRWATAPLLAVVLLADVALLGRSPLYTLMLAGQAAFYATAAAGLAAERAGLSLGRLAVPYYFCVVTAAAVGGFARFVRGRAQAVWAPTGQAVVERAT
jgi:cellulose synthase/poly-beta-1,6-N-acetylglucosamine synthase-like glycosyltransferase